MCQFQLFFFNNSFAHFSSHAVCSSSLKSVLHSVRIVFFLENNIGCSRGLSNMCLFCHGWVVCSSFSNHCDQVLANCNTHFMAHKLYVEASIRIEIAGVRRVFAGFLFFSYTEQPSSMNQNNVVIEWIRVVSAHGFFPDILTFRYQTTSRSFLKQGPYRLAPTRTVMKGGGVGGGNPYRPCSVSRTA